MTFAQKVSRPVMKEVFFWSFSANRLWLYPDKPSINDSVFYPDISIWEWEIVLGTGLI